MGSAMAHGWIRAQLPDFELSMVRRQTGVPLGDGLESVKLVTADAPEVAAADVIVLAMKPWQVEEAVQKMLPDLKDGVLVISVAAGVTLEQLRTMALNRVRMVRAMPNTAVAFGAGVVAVAGAPADCAAAQDILAPMGYIPELPEEKFDAVTALSGCGLAHALRFLRAAQTAGIRMGLPADVSKHIFARVMQGAATIADASPCHPEEEIDRVCTPGGLTIRGMVKLEQGGFSAAMVDGLLACLPPEKQ